MKFSLYSFCCFIWGLLFISPCCFAQRLPTHLELISAGPSADNIRAQIGATSIDVLEYDLGDLNGDGLDEFVAAIETPVIIEDARERLVVIFEKQEGRWILLKSSASPILNSEEGGIMGDPFEGLGIHDKELHISHYGGSNWRWWMQDTYGYDGVDFVLINHQSYWGSLCDEKIEWEINLKEGTATCQYALEECPEGFGNNGHLDSIPNSETFDISKANRIILAQRRDTIISFVSPKHGFETSL